jgi:hypothetical protein
MTPHSSEEVQWQHSPSNTDVVTHQSAALLAMKTTPRTTILIARIAGKHRINCCKKVNHWQTLLLKTQATQAHANAVGGRFYEMSNGACLVFIL